MNTKKLLLSEEILRMAEIFSHMGINVLLEGRMLGREAGTGIEALAPGSAIRSLVGETTAKNIEDDFIRAAENSQNIMRQIGKNVGDGVTMDELETAFFATNRAAVAARVLDAMEPAAAKQFMDNTANYIFNKNSSATGTARAGTTDAALKSLNSMIKTNMSEVTAENLLNNVSAFRNAIDGLADDAEKANWKKSLDLAETQAKTVKLKPAEGPVPGPRPEPGPGPGPRPEPGPGPGPGPMPGPTPFTPLNIRNFVSQHVEDILTIRGKTLPPRVKDKIVNDATDALTAEYRRFRINQITEDNWNAIPLTEKQNLIEQFLNKVQREFEEGISNKSAGDQQKMRTWWDRLTYPLRNKEGDVTFMSLLKFYGVGAGASLVICLMDNSDEKPKEIIKDCYKKTLGSWLGAFKGLYEVIGGALEEGYENTNEGFQSWCQSKTSSDTPPGPYTKCNFDGLWFTDSTNTDKKAIYDEDNETFKWDGN